MNFIRWNWENYWLTWKRSFDFRGVTPRNRFWSFVIVEFLLMLLYILPVYFLIVLVGQGKPITDTPWGGFFGLLLGLFVGFFGASILPLFSCQVRRIRDATGRGAWILLGFIPYAGNLIVTVLSLYPTRKRLN